jgi:RND family efflux transporter MFP subunit
MRPSSLNIAALLLMLATGIAIGNITSHELPKANAAADQPAVPAAPPPVTPVVENTEAAVHDAKHIGVVFVRQSADVAARSDGVIQAVYANLGDRVKAGDLIAQIDSYSAGQQLEMAEAMLRSAQADERDLDFETEEARVRYSRRERLAAEGLISREDLSTARVQLDRAEAKLQAAKARVAEQTARVGDVKGAVANTSIRAPFDGTVAARYLDPGAAVRFGTAIISLIQSDDLWVRFAVPQSAQSRVRIGTPIRFELTGAVAPIPGIIEYIAPSLAGTSQELLVEARLNPPAALRNVVRTGASGQVSTRER